MYALRQLVKIIRSTFREKHVIFQPSSVLLLFIGLFLKNLDTNSCSFMAIYYPKNLWNCANSPKTISYHFLVLAVILLLYPNNLYFYGSTTRNFLFQLLELHLNNELNFVRSYYIYTSLTYTKCIWKVFKKKYQWYHQLYT